MRYFTIEFDELRIIDIGAETGFDRFKVRSMAVARNLHPVREPL
jgi:hypothetical protein